MLTFFRRIRKGLLGDGATSKYLVYAIGEIALVVIGILIALQINNWNEWRKDRIKEREVLSEIASNIQTNISFIEFNLNREKRWANSCEIVLNVIQGRKPWSDTLGVHFNQALSSRVPTLSFTAYESLKNVGVEIITHKDLQESIIDLYETEFNNLITVMTRIVQTELKPNTTPFILANFEQLINEEEGDSFMPNDYEHLLQSQEFINLLKYMQGRRKRPFEFLQKRSLGKSQIILQLIKDELGESE